MRVVDAIDAPSGSSPVVSGATAPLVLSFVPLIIAISGPAAAQPLPSPDDEPAPAQLEPAAPAGRTQRDGDASEDGPDDGPDDEGSAITDTDPHTMFLGGVGLLALPFAEVCPFTEAPCEPGETSLGFSLYTLGRIGDWAFGASITYAFGLRPTEAAGFEEPGLERQHTRRYFLVEGHFRRYLPALGRWNWWVGPTVGAVIINDSWSTLADREPYADTAFVGPRAVTLATEGFAFGAAVGGHIRFLDYWLFGTHFRYANWLLPGEREQTPVGDLASHAGRLDLFDLGVVTGFHLPI